MYNNGSFPEETESVQGIETDMNTDINTDANANEDSKEETYKVQRKKRAPLMSSTQFWTAFIKSVLAGVMITIGLIAYFRITNKVLGSIAFSISFFVIYSYGLTLYNDKVGYSLSKGASKNLLLIPIWIGNLTGTLLTGYALQLTRLSKTVAKRALTLANTRLTDNIWSILIMAFFCGIVMFVSADTFKNASNSIQKYIAVFLPAVVFMLCGFEHCVVDMAIFTLSRAWKVKSVWSIIVVTIGNAAGALLIPICHSAIKSINVKKTAKQQ